MRRFATVTVLLVVALMAGIMAAPTAMAAPVLSFANTQYTPGLGWDVVGLDSNNVNVGPNEYAKGARVCNTGDATATNVVVQWHWESDPSPSAYINLQPGSPSQLSWASLPAGECVDAYFNITVTRNTNAWDTFSRYYITATADTLGIISTQNCYNTANNPGACGTGPYDGYRQLFVEKLISQNRNNVNFIRYLPTVTADNNGGPTYTCTNGYNTGSQSSPNVVIVGEEYYICLNSSTATNGYEQITTYINLPNTIFQTLSVESTYTAPPGGVGDQIYEDACQWFQNPYNAEYWRKNNSDDCQGTGKYGGTVQMVFKVRIIAAGGPATASALVYDFSGSSFHYNGGGNTGGFLACPENCLYWEAKDPPWAAKFESLSAASVPGGGAEVAWRTGLESDNLGFNVYSGDADSKVKVNDDLIAGSAFSASGPLGAGSSYRSQVPAGPQAAGPFWIESVSTDGTTEMHGPVALEGSRPRAARASVTMGSLAARRGTTALVARVARGAGDGAAAAALAQGPAAKVAVDHEGWYTVPLSELASAGVDVSVPSNLHLYAEGVEQPVKISGDALEFYGIGLDTPSTDTRVYWIVASDGPAPTIPSESPTPGTQGPTSFAATVERRDRVNYFSTLLNGDGNNFFGAPVMQSGTDQAITVPHVADAAGATLDVSLQGATDGPHLVNVELNGQALGTVEFKDKRAGEAMFPATGLVDGPNTVRLTSAGPLDVSLVDAIRVHYQRSLVADDDALRFTAPGGTQVSVGGFGGPGVRIADVTDAAAPVEIAGEVGDDGNGGSQITATVPGDGERTLYAFGATQSGGVTANKPSHLRSVGNSADMLVLTTAELKASVKPLVAMHRREGLRTRVVDITDVYDEFGAGQKGPRPVKDFLRYAHRQWSRAPRYVLLGGDASLDPRGFQGKDGSDLVPTRMLDTARLEVPSDNWLADADGDMRPDVAIGRLPAGDTGEMDAMVTKTVVYSGTAPSRSALIPFDGGDDYDYAGAADIASKAMPATVDVRKLNGGHVNSRQRMLEAIAAGPSVVNYVGHGSVNLWRGGLFENADAAGLANTAHPAFLVAMTCLNGYFVDEGLDSLSEAWLNASGGAVVTWASSGYTYPDDQKVLSRALFGRLFSSSPRVGDAAVFALRASSDRDNLRSWVLLGDPAVRIR